MNELEKPTPTEIALIAAALGGSEPDKGESGVRAAILLWKLSETKLKQLQRFEGEVSDDWEEWAELDSDPERLAEWLNGQKPIPKTLLQESEGRIVSGKAAVAKLGVKKPPLRHSFTFSSVAEKILPQRNNTERARAADTYLANEIDSLPAGSALREWLEKNRGKSSKEEGAWWIWAELLVRWQKKKGRFKSHPDSWKENLRQRREENRPRTGLQEIDCE